MTVLAFFAAVSCLVVLLPGAWGNSTGAPPQAEIQGCTCHKVIDAKDVNLSVQGLPEKVEAGKEYRLTFVVDAPVDPYDPDPVLEKVPYVGQRPAPQNLRLGGFLGNVSVGTLAPVDDNAQPLLRPGGGESATSITHTSEGARLRAWNGTWKVPDNASRLPNTVYVRFYGMQSDGDGTSGHDNWTRSEVSIDALKPDPPAPPPPKPASAPVFATTAATIAFALARSRS